MSAVPCSQVDSSRNSKVMQSTGENVKSSKGSIRQTVDENRRILVKSENSQKNHIPSIVITRGKNDNRSIKPRKKDEFINRPRTYHEERRGNYRGGRGGLGGRKDEYISRASFSESMNSRKSDVSGKYSNETGNLYRSDFPGLPEDSRISSTLRRLAKEEDEKKFEALCKNLQEALALPDNAAYIRRSLDMIFDSLLDLLSNGITVKFRQLASLCLGHLGYNLNNDFKKYIYMLFNKYTNETNEDNRRLLMNAILELTNLDKENPKLQEYAQMLMTEIREVMESTDVGEIFTVTAEITINLTERYPDTFTEYFHDTVDIIVGWHIDTNQDPRTTQCAASCLRKLAPYWYREMSFTISLLLQFIEDGENYRDELLSPTEETVPAELFKKITSFIEVFTSVFAGLGMEMNPQRNSHVTWGFLSEALNKIINLVLSTLPVALNHNVLIAGNKCITEMMKFMDAVTADTDSLLNYLYSQIGLSITDNITLDTLSSLFALAVKVMVVSGTKLTDDFVDTMLGANSILLVTREYSIKETSDVYFALLHHLPIGPAIRAYMHIVADLDMALRVLNETAEPLIPLEENLHSATEYNKIQAMDILEFTLKVFSDLVNASNSLLTLCVLKPNLIDILVKRLPPIVSPIVLPKLHFAYLDLLRVNCSKNGYFISANGFLNRSGNDGLLHLADVIQVPDGVVPATSLATILSIIDLIISNLEQPMEPKNKNLVISWGVDLLLAARPWKSVLLQTEEVNKLVKAVINAASDCNPAITLEAAAKLYDLINLYDCLWPEELMFGFIDLIMYFLSSTDASVRVRYHEIMLRLPSTVVMSSINRCATPKSSRINRYLFRQYEEISKGYLCEITPTLFKHFMNYLLLGEHEDGTHWMTEILVRSCPIFEVGFDRGCTTLHSLAMITEWIAFQTAYLCVDNKMRTPLGKPILTVTAIECVIRELAKNTLNRKCEMISASGRRVRTLMQFIEQLEKCMYNATEGTASAFPPVSKAVKTFFQTNRAPCFDWFTRTRLALLVVSLHSGLASSAVRHGYSLLQAMLDMDSTQNNDFESALLHTGWALACMGEKDAVQGLYVWARDMATVKHPLLKPLVEVAARRYESAATSFHQIVETSTEDKDREKLEKAREGTETVRSFLSDQIIESYLAVNNWKDLVNWKHKEADFIGNENGGPTNTYNFITTNFCQSMELFEKEEFSAAKELLAWDCQNHHQTKDHLIKWDFTNILAETDISLKNLAVMAATLPDLPDCCSQKLSEIRATLQDIVEASIKDAPSEILCRAVILQYVSDSLLRKVNLFDSPFYDKCKQWKMNFTSPEMEQATWWYLALDRIYNRGYPSEPMKKFLLQSIKHTRKIGNYHNATALMNRYLGLLNVQTNLPDKDPTVITDSVMEVLKNRDSKLGLDEARALQQLAKILKSCGELKPSVELSSFVVDGLLSSVRHQYENREQLPDMMAVVASLLRDLASALQFNADKQQCADGVYLQKLLQMQISSDNDSVELKSSSHPILNEYIAGRLLRLSLNTDFASSKSWEHLGAWTYSCGLEETSKRTLTDSDKTKVAECLMETDMDATLVQEIFKLLTAPYNTHDVEVDTTSTEMIEQQLRSVGQLTSEQLSKLVAIWKSTHGRVYSFFKCSAFSYFKYLQMSQFKEDDAVLVRATLRLLRLIVKHASELQDEVEAGLANTPTAPWISIVPQLFSRLNHPEQYVRKRVSELLTRIGIDSPHLIVFPAVVGSHTGASTIKDMPATKLFNVKKRTYVECEDVYEEFDEEDQDDNEEDEIIDDDDDEMKNSNERAAVLENSFTIILDALSRKYGEEISQVRTLVRELRRITLLWDELWLGTLIQHQADISRRFVQLASEVRDTDWNTNLTEECKNQLVTEKFRLILKPLLFVLEQLHAITSVSPETPHEREFQEKFGKDIDTLLVKLKEPTNPRQPNEAWHAIKGLQTKLHARANKRTSVCLSMGDISPALATLSATKISMPGVRSHVSIQSIENNVAVLPTKTKPKKLIFNGSNGRRYTYLFKGLEDLHLDERIMQFLSIANAMLKEPHLRAHHYSVVPLGPRSGLISWVENVTPIFSLYKKWQQRDCHAGSLEERPVLRPSELFYSKLGPILKESGIMKIDPMQRHKWPVSALKKCLVELMQSTPTYLLSKELWCQSVNAADWWRVTKLYSSSLAVMSIIGYIIGLGDRHLDNVLVNLKTGEVVHIDYNVCFEKGKTLRVPEKVPFRLTPNLRAALGVTGIEGIYRLTCEHVLKVLKEGHETLLTLLEAFVYDPLIDWTPLNEGGYTGAVYGGGRKLASVTKQSKKELEKEVTCSMFKVRITEAKHQWLENKKLLLKELSEMMDLLEFWQAQEKKLRNIQQSLQERHTELALLNEAEGQPHHSLYTLGVRCSKYSQVCNAKLATVNTLKARIQESEQQLSSFKGILSSMRGPEMSRWIKEVNSRPRHDVCQVFDLIKEFLQNAGQVQTVQQCIQSEKDVGELLIQQSQLTLSLLDMLVQYWEISRQYPASYLKTHRATLYKRWAEMLLQDMSPEKCNEIMQEMSRELAPNEELLRQTGMYSAGLHRQLAECHQYLARVVERGAAQAAVNAQPSSIAGNAQTPFKLDVSQADPVCLEAVVLNALTALNKRFLMMEAAATSAGDCLLNLTSRDGDWFLENMVLIGSTVLKLIQLLPSLNREDADPNVLTAVKCLQFAHSQFKELQEVHNNFTGIILVEAMQAMQCEEPSVTTMLSQLEVVVTSVSPLSLADLISQLQRHLRFTIMGMESPYEYCMAWVELLRVGFQSLMPHSSTASGGDCSYSGEEAAPLSQGDMLLMGFNGLFDNVQMCRETMLSHLNTLKSPPAWKIVDQVREAKSHYTAPICEEVPKAILEAMFFVKRLSTILEVLRMCRDDSAGFRCASNAPPVPHDRDSLTKPVRRYIADYISYQLLGVFSLSLATAVCLLLQQNGFDVTGEVEQKDIGAQSRVPLEELCKKMAERLGRAQQLRQVSGLVSQAETVWRQEELLKRIEQDAVNARALLHRIQVAITAYHWLHEHYLVNSPPPPINRAGFMTELRKSMSALLAIQPKIKEALEHQNTLVASTEQRLKWAAGANPALNEVMSAFESSVATNRERIESEVSLALVVANMSNAVLQHEALRTPTPEAIANDNSIVRLVEDCEKLYYLLKNKPVALSTAEEGLVALIPPKKKIDQEWITAAEDLISESVRKLKSELEPQQLQMWAAEDLVKTKASSIRMAMAKHHRIIADIKTVLKTMVKYEDAGLSGLEKYLARYKKFTDLVSSMTKTLGMIAPLNAAMISAALEQTRLLQTLADDIYGEMLKFTVSDSPAKRPQLIRQSTLVSDSPKKESQARRTHLGIQERNAYAMSVWRRVKFKLEGRDPDPGVRSTEKQQVDWAISEATNLENLALLYEGWTPWV